MSLIYSEIFRQKDLSFDKYLSIDSYSHSSLKQIKDGIKRDFFITDKVRIGKIVDEILTQKSADISNQLYPIAKEISLSMRSEIGESILSLFEFQLSYSAYVEDEFGIGFKIKGRPDAELKRKMIVDFKVTDQNAKRKEDLIPLIEFMGYDNQLWNYSKMSNCESKILFIYSRKAKKTFFFKRECNNAESWWSEKILEHGNIREI